MEKPILLQSFWRTSSTYFWNKFREAAPSLRCYFEPDHPSLVKTTSQLEQDFSRASRKFDLGFINKNYYAEFPHNEAGSVSLFDWHFSVDRYHLRPTEPHDEMKQYLNNLVMYGNNQQQRSLMQFNRSVLRAAWMQHELDAVSIYINRSPADMWQSYNRLGYYLPCFLGIVGQNSDDPIFSEMAERLNVKPESAPNFLGHYRRARRKFKEMDSADSKDMVGFFWVLGLAHAFTHADTIIDLELFKKEDKNSNASASVAAIEEKTNISLDLLDLKIKTYSVKEIEMSPEVKALTQRALHIMGFDMNRTSSYPLADTTQRLLCEITKS